MKSIRVLVLALVVALTVLGVTAAGWTQPMDVAGDVTMGELDARFCIWAMGDNESDYYPCCEPGVTDIVAVGSGHEIVATITNAYPSITYYVDFDIANIGSIPVHLGKWEVVGGNLPACSTVSITNLCCNCLDPNEDATARLTVHMCDDAAELATYWFRLRLVVNQCNQKGSCS